MFSNKKSVAITFGKNKRMALNRPELWLNGSTDLDKIIGTPGIFGSSLTLALNFSLAKPDVFQISFFMDCAIVSM